MKKSRNWFNWLVFLSQYVWSSYVLFGTYAERPKNGGDGSEDDPIVDLYAFALWATGFCMIAYLEIFGYFRQFMFKLWSMVICLAPLGVFTLIFVVPLNSILWFTTATNWAPDNKRNFKYQVILTLGALTGQVNPYNTIKYNINAWRIFLFCAMLVLNVIVLMKFLVSFTSNALKAANLISVQEGQGTKLRYILDSIEVITFMQCRKKSNVPYLKKLPGTTGPAKIEEESESLKKFMVDEEFENSEKPAQKGDQYIYCVYGVEEKIAGKESVDPLTVWRTKVERRVDTVYNQIEMLDKQYTKKYEKYDEMINNVGKKE